MKKLLLTFLISTFATGLIAQSNPDKKAIQKTLENFREAIVENDTESATRLLHNGARILEGSNIETKEEYLSHHFHSDGKFLSAMNIETISQEINVKGNTAWVSTKSSLKGVYNDRELDLDSLELAVLTKTENGWEITALHWSSN